MFCYSFGRSFSFSFFFFFKQKTAYGRRISDWSSDVCSSDLRTPVAGDTVTDAAGAEGRRRGRRGPVIAVVDVAPGQRYSFASIDIQADPTLPPALIEDAFPLAVGEPIVAQRVQGAEAAIALKLPQAGYPFEKIGRRDILPYEATGGGAIWLPVEIDRKSKR